MHWDPSQLIHFENCCTALLVPNWRSDKQNIFYRISRESCSSCSTIKASYDSLIDPDPAVPGAMGKLDFKDPVPSDIDIAQSVAPAPISEIAQKLQISAEDFEPHGTTKAKVSTII